MKRRQICYGAASNGVSPPVAVRSMLCDFGNSRDEKIAMGLARCAKPLRFYSRVAHSQDKKDAEHNENGGQEGPQAQLLARDEIAKRERDKGVHVGVACNACGWHAREKPDV